MSGLPLLFLYLSLTTGLQTSEEQELIPSIKSLQPRRDRFPLSLGGREEREEGGDRKGEVRQKRERQAREEEETKVLEQLIQISEPLNASLIQEKNFLETVQ